MTNALEVIQTETTITLDRKEVEELVTVAVTRAFRDLGITAGDQASVAELRAIREDMSFLREWRQLCEEMRHKGVATAVLMSMGALAVVMLLGIKQWFFQ